MSIILMMPYANIIEAALIDTLRAEANQYEQNQSFQFVPISVDDITIIIPVGTGLPADPADNGNSTIAGIDSDGDGIRDDVERRISMHYPDNPLARAYSYMLAIRLQTIIENSTNKNSYIQAIHELSFAEDCLKNIMPTVRTKGTRLVLPWVMNTYPRSYSYINARGLIGGETPPALLSCQ